MAKTWILTEQGREPWQGNEHMVDPDLAVQVVAHMHLRLTGRLIHAHRIFDHIDVRPDPDIHPDPHAERQRVLDVYATLRDEQPEALRTLLRMLDEWRPCSVGRCTREAVVMGMCKRCRNRRLRERRAAEAEARKAYVMAVTR